MEITVSGYCDRLCFHLYMIFSPLFFNLESKLIKFLVYELGLQEESSFTLF